MAIPTFDCLQALVVLDACATAPAGTIAINQLPGMSIKSINAAANDEQDSYIQVFNDACAIALPKFSLFLRSELRKLVKVGCSCDIEEIVCADPELFTLPWAYFVAAEILNFRINSDRCNRFTTIKTDAAAALKEQFETDSKQFLVDSLCNLDLTNCCKERNLHLDYKYPHP